jgi:hypothetical protein
MRDSERYKVKELRKIIEDYMDNDSQTAEVKLAGMKDINGEDLLEALKYIETDKQRYQEALLDLGIITNDLDGTLKEIKEKINFKSIEKKLENKKLSEEK